MGDRPRLTQSEIDGLAAENASLKAEVERLRENNPELIIALDALGKIVGLAVSEDRDGNTARECGRLALGAVNKIQKVYAALRETPDSGAKEGE